VRVGDQLPPEAEDCVGFVDRSSFEIGRPVGNYAYQAIFWSVKSKFHCLGYQAFTGMDGLCMHFYG